MPTTIYGTGHWVPFRTSCFFLFHFFIIKLIRFLKDFFGINKKEKGI